LTDLSHWDFAERFSGYDAAALILGLEPRESEADEWRVRVVCERMELHYKRALLREFERFLGDPARPVSDDDDREPEKDLRSVKLDDLVFRATQFEAHQHLSDWFADRRLNRFENQEFTRKAIARWLVAIGMDSNYQFDRLRSPDTDRPCGTGSTSIPPIQKPQIPMKPSPSGYAGREKFREQWQMPSLPYFVQTACRPARANSCSTPANPGLARLSRVVDPHFRRTHRVN
jgi:hypothetical protein